MDFTRTTQVLEKDVGHAVGSLARPMGDDDLERKFRGLCEPILAIAQTDALSAQCWQLDAMLDAGQVARVTVQESQSESSHAIVNKGVAR